MWRQFSKGKIEIENRLSKVKMFIASFFSGSSECQKYKDTLFKSKMRGKRVKRKLNNATYVPKEAGRRPRKLDYFLHR